MDESQHDRMAGDQHESFCELVQSPVEQLGDGSIRNDVVFADKGHGALVLQTDAPLPDLLAVTGPRRALLVESGAQPYLAVPHGDMMLAGNFGLLRAYATHDAQIREAVERRLGPPGHVRSALGV